MTIFFAGRHVMHRLTHCLWRAFYDKSTIRVKHYFRIRFRPALAGLVLASEGRSLDKDTAGQAGARRFPGWFKTRHWLLADV